MPEKTARIRPARACAEVPTSMLLSTLSYRFNAATATSCCRPSTAQPPHSHLCHSSLSRLPSLIGRHLCGSAKLHMRSRQNRIFWREASSDCCRNRPRRARQNRCGLPCRSESSGCSKPCADCWKKAQSAGTAIAISCNQVRMNLKATNRTCGPVPMPYPEMGTEPGTRR
jgi:hypothetical protein